MAGAANPRLDLPVVDLASPDLHAAAKSIRKVQRARPAPLSFVKISFFFTLIDLSTLKKSRSVMTYDRRAWSTASST